MITALNENTGSAQTALATATGRLLSEATPKYIDLGLVVNGDVGGNGYQLAAGAVATVSTIENIEWVRHIVYFFKGTSGGTADIAIARVSTSNLTTNMYGVTTPACTGAWNSGVISPGAGVILSTAPSSILGKRAKISIRNNGATVADMNLHLQLMG